MQRHAHAMHCCECYEAPADAMLPVLALLQLSAWYPWSATATLASARTSMPARQPAQSASCTIPASRTRCAHLLTPIHHGPGMHVLCADMRPLLCLLRSAQHLALAVHHIVRLRVQPRRSQRIPNTQPWLARADSRQRLIMRRRSGWLAQGGRLGPRAHCMGGVTDACVRARHACAGSSAVLRGTLPEKL